MEVCVAWCLADHENNPPSMQAKTDEDRLLIVDDLTLPEAKTVGLASKDSKFPSKIRVCAFHDGEWLSFTMFAETS